MFPGILVQKITTKRPTDDMIEVAICSMEEALTADGETDPGRTPTGSSATALGLPSGDTPVAGDPNRSLPRRLRRRAARGAMTDLDAKLAEVAAPIRRPPGGSARPEVDCDPDAIRRLGRELARGSSRSSPRTGRSSATRRRALRSPRAARLPGRDEELRQMARDEVTRLEADESRLLEDLRVLLLPRDPNDERDVILEIRGGAGGEEAALFAAELLRMYLRYAERHRFGRR